MIYGPLLQLPVGAQPSDVAMADLDHDGRLDIAITERGHDTLAIFRQLPGNTFPARASATYYVPSAPATLVNLPLNGYGLTGMSPKPPSDDLAVGAANNAYFYLFDNASSVPGVLALTRRPFFLWQNGSSVPLVNPRLVTGRFGDDLWFDLGYLYDASFPRGLGGMAIPRNSTSASIIQPRIHYSTFQNPYPNFTPIDFTLADLVGRGEPLDVVMPSPATDEVIAIYRRIPFSFNSVWWEIGEDDYLPSYGTRPVCAAAADVDGDGGADLVTGHETSLNAVVQLHDPGMGRMVFTSARLTYALPAVPKQMVLADLNGDNRPELLVLLNNATLRVYRNTGQSGAGRFDLASGATLLTHPNPVYMRLADVDADGHPDIVLACRGDDTVSIFYSSGQVLATAAAAEFTVAVYPNPARGAVQLRWPIGVASGPVVLVDMLGRVVRRWPAATSLLPVQDLPRGVYVLRTELSGRPLTQRLVLE